MNKRIPKILSRIKPISNEISVLPSQQGTIDEDNLIYQPKFTRDSAGKYQFGNDSGNGVSSTDSSGSIEYNFPGGKEYRKAKANWPS